jgi:hypothetical protein
MNLSMLHAILEGREWSWSVLGFVAIVLGLIIRSLMLRGILRGMKVRDAHWYRRMLFYYEKRSIFGWICFVLAVSGATLLWRFENLFLKYLSNFEWFLVLLMFYILSLFLHVRAYAGAIVETVSENISSDRDL